ncbi:hypothetical protein EGR_09385 [Echinococcus granulosus]|uniref:Uncharacterized protein n=1 Tax=Echinococcus granulosus TaxID=6210 RepID=W6UBA5_ECHGR|nr:hypothetical protein EGR_09385 [Echinococcus granulosus]EUB55727.1 hypothetical protein EGR_09385 [Echinococcus granulosus]
MSKPNDHHQNDQGVDIIHSAWTSALTEHYMSIFKSAFPNKFTVTVCNLPHLAAANAARCGMCKTESLKAKTAITSGRPKLNVKETFLLYKMIIVSSQIINNTSWTLYFKKSLQFKFNNLCKYILSFSPMYDASTHSYAHSYIYTHIHTTYVSTPNMEVVELSLPASKAMKGKSGVECTTLKLSRRIKRLYLHTLLWKPNQEQLKVKLKLLDEATCLCLHHLKSRNGRYGSSIHLPFLNKAQHVFIQRDTPITNENFQSSITRHCLRIRQFHPFDSPIRRTEKHNVSRG